MRPNCFGIIGNSAKMCVLTMAPTRYGTCCKMPMTIPFAKRQCPAVLEEYIGVLGLMQGVSGSLSAFNVLLAVHKQRQDTRHLYVSVKVACAPIVALLCSPLGLPLLEIKFLFYHNL